MESGNAMKFGIGIIGATGYIGTPYREEIRECGDEAKIIAICARRLDRLEQAAVTDGAELATTDWRAVVEHPQVNLIMVLTPDALHREPVLASAELNKAVFCEKPVSKTIRDTTEMYRAVQSSGIASYVPFWTRYVPVFVRVRQLIEAGKLGEVRNVIYRWHNPRPVAMPFTWRDDANLSAAGSIADVGSHIYDTLRFLLNDEADQVLTDARTIMPPKPDLGSIDLTEAIDWGETHAAGEAGATRAGSVPDYAQIAVEFKSGIVGSILLSHASYIRKGFSPELEIHGTKASLSVDRNTGEIRLADSPELARSLETISDTGFCNRFKNHVFPALRQANSTTDHPTLYDGWRVQIFTDAALASAQRGEWVKLSEFESAD